MSRLTAPERDRLAAEHLPVARALAFRRHQHSSEDLDELVADALLGLAEALNRYDPSRGIPFRAYAIPRMIGAIMDGKRVRDHLTRGERRRAVAAGIDDSPALARATSFEVTEDWLTLAAPEQDHDLRMHLEDLIDGLPERERFVLVMRHQWGLTNVELGDAMGITASRVSQIFHKAASRLRLAVGEAAA